MFTSMGPSGRFTAALVAVLSPCSAFACATCGCTLNSDAAMGYSAETGWRISLEYDFIDQGQLRSGANPISAPQVAEINNLGGNQEVEKQTINRYTTLSLHYTPSADWNVSALVPYIDRSHTTYGAATTAQITPGQVSYADSSGLGDVKLIASYQGLLPTHNLGLQFGVKLPTGDYGGQNVVTGAFVGRNPVVFSAGPGAGTALDTSLNPGTGSTDVILGAYYYQAVSQDFDAFANVQFQGAVAEKLNQANADFRPGNVTTMSLGVRYEADPAFVPQFQVNMTHKAPDQGALADTIDTAGDVIYLSPGATVLLAKNLYAFGFVQVPVYSQLQHYQVFPRWTASAGVSYAF